MDNNAYKNIVPRKWIPTAYGTPNKNVTKVLVKTAEGFIYEAVYNRHGKDWLNTNDGSIIRDVKEWSLCSDSVPEQTRIR